MNKYQKEYIYRINRVIDYIENNLGEELSLARLSDVANFSQYHFHRIFSAFMGETINEFIKRKRLEKAAGLLLSDPEQPVSEIAGRCGFNSVSVFCRNFRERYRLTAQEFRAAPQYQHSKNDQTDSKRSQMISGPDHYVCDINTIKNRRFIMKKDVEIMDMPAMNVIYCRHTGQFSQIAAAYEKLFRWAGPRGLLSSPEVKSLTYYHDDPNITEIDKVRQSACLVTNREVKTEGEIGKMNIPGGKHFVAHFEITPAEFQDAWDSACLWLSESGYQPADGNPYELYHKHEDYPEKKFVVDICIPVKPLQ